MKSQKRHSPPCEVRSFDSADELAKAAAADWFELLQMLEMAGREPRVGLSGGRIAAQFFDAACKLLAGHERAARATHFFWADERGVPAEHPESNYGLAWRHLLKPLSVPESHIHRIAGELEPAMAASVAGRALAKWTGAGPGEIGAMDVVLLGMGEDGHVASLFPGESADVMQRADAYRPVTGPKPPPQRVTMGYGVLQRADNVWVLISGAGKEEALQRSLVSCDETPLGRVLASRTHTRIYTDLL